MEGFSNADPFLFRALVQLGREVLIGAGLWGRIEKSCYYPASWLTSTVKTQVQLRWLGKFSLEVLDPGPTSGRYMPERERQNFRRLFTRQIQCP
jgi:hypothetical protein